MNFYKVFFFMQFALLNDTPQWNVKNNELNWRFCNCNHTVTVTKNGTNKKAKNYIIIIFIEVKNEKKNEKLSLFTN